MHDEDNKASFHRFDIWHNVQMGQGKSFAASSLVTLLDFFQGSSVDGRLENMSQDFLQYCKDSCLQTRKILVMKLEST